MPQIEIIFCFIVILFASYFSGFIPKFLVPKLTYFNIGPEMDSLAFFDVNRDASKVRWEREANSRQAVKAAMNSNFFTHIINNRASLIVSRNIL